MDFANWPKCAVPACRFKCCLALGSKYCWPHTPGSAFTARQNLRETEPSKREGRKARRDEVIDQDLAAIKAALEAGPTPAKLAPTLKEGDSSPPRWHLHETLQAGQ
jgi:hypothetical protein